MKNILEPGTWYLLTVLFLVGCSTELQVAAERGNVQSVMELLDEGENISETNSQGWTALHYASRAGRDTVVSLLLNKQAAIDARGDKGETPLFMAAYNCHPKIVRALLDTGADFTIPASPPDNDAWITPLLSASKKGCDPTILKDLLDAGADGNEVDRKYGWSPLIFAANIGHLQAVNVLLSAGADVNHQANDGLTALIVAAGSGHRDVVQILLEADADVRIRASQGGGELNDRLAPTDTALSVAQDGGHSDVVALLEAAERENKVN